MGWWSTNIMGGDTPLDFEDSFFDICKVKKFPEPGKMNELSKEDIANHLDEMIAYIHKGKSAYEDTINIVYQVLAVLMLKAGAFISADLADFIMQACENDEWAQESDERKIETNGLFKALASYDNEHPIVIKSKGLFEVMSEKLGN